MLCGHYAHIECLKEWKRFHANYKYKCLECGKNVSYPSFFPYILFLIIITCIIILNNIYTEKQYIDDEIEKELLIQYDTLQIKMFSKKLEINDKFREYCEEENELYKTLKIILYKLRYIERLKIINNLSVLQKVLYLFKNHNSDYQDLKTICF
jgi:hypothetical protein